MELKLHRAIFVLLILAGIGYSIFWNTMPGGSEAFQKSETPAELLNHDFSWRYENGWDFNITINEDGLHWQGIGGDFDGMSMSVHPHYRKVAENIYFVTWVVPYAGLDSLVIDFNENKVFAHSKANSKFFSLEGEIYCNDMHQACAKPIID